MTPQVTDRHNRPRVDDNTLRFGDPIKGEHEQKPGELLDDAEVTRRADEQRAEAQKDEHPAYPGDSGKQAAAKAKARLSAQDKALAKATEETVEDHQEDISPGEAAAKSKSSK